MSNKLVTEVGKMAIYTIARDYQLESVIMKSRFICTLRKVNSEEDAQAFIKSLKKQYWDATHNCSAYIIGTGGTRERAHDDGEPVGTAGQPMLEVLRKREVQNVAAVVTRYFGGIKLGAGGLVRAYAGSVNDTVQAAGLAEIVPMGTFALRQELETIGKVLNTLYQQRLFTVQEVVYGQPATILLRLPLAEQQQVEAWLTETLNTMISIELIATGFSEQALSKGDGEKA
ncbi:MAG: YigZ family protein [Acidaminococcaceae bacterium]